MIRPTRRQGGFTLVELLVVIAIISIIAGLVIPGLQRAIGEANKTTCLNNLRGLHTAAFLYSRRGGSFPFAKVPAPRAHDSLNALLESPYGEDLEPENFFCPAGEALEVSLVEGEEGSPRFLLDEETLSYTWVAKRTKSTRRGYLSSDKYFDEYEDGDGVHSGHRGAVLALDTSGRVKEIAVSDGLLREDGLLPGLVR